MLVFNADKIKDVAMVIETSNTNDDQLEFMFMLEVDNVQYGFKCDVVDDRVKIHIPVLNDIINNIKEGEYKAFLQVTGNNNYLMKPFHENVKIVVKPKIDVLLSQDDDIKEELKLSISKIIDQEVKETKDTKSTKEETKSKISKFFE